MAFCSSVTEVQVVDVELITKQFHHLQADIDFKVVKIGLLCASEQIRVIADLVQDKTIVLDPIKALIALERVQPEP
jgi:hydroxymethylpyrimidine/phosphomethylpyrimidine kinase